MVKVIESPTAQRQHEDVLRQNERIKQEILEWLRERYTHVSQSGDIAPENCWLEVAKCHNRPGSFQVFYRSTEPIFNGKKRKYIGMRNSPKHQQAADAIERRDYLHSISLQIKELQNV